MENKEANVPKAKTKCNKSQSYTRMFTTTSNTGKTVRGKVRPKSKSTSALPRSKNDNYKVVSKNSLLQDFKNTALNGFSSVKLRINSFSALLKHSTNKKDKAEVENYCPMDNEQTPVKLYSPFTIESPQIDKTKMEEKERMRKHLFASPSNKIKQDVAELESGLNELNILTKRLQNSYQPHSKSSQEFSPFILEGDYSLI